LVQNLTKSFGALKAVNDLTLSIKKNEVFTLLGHNGAGKTTAIQMMTGILRPTSGEVLIYGNPVSTELDTVQQNLGLC